jgi:hypothetical protein
MAGLIIVAGIMAAMTMAVDMTGPAVMVRAGVIGIGTAISRQPEIRSGL